MKQKNCNKAMHIHLDYLLEIAQKLPQSIASRKVKDFINISRKIQARLGRTKRNICFVCSTVLIPKVNGEFRMEKSAEGFGLSITCSNCNSGRFIISK